MSIIKKIQTLIDHWKFVAVVVIGQSVINYKTLTRKIERSIREFTN